MKSRVRALKSLAIALKELEPYIQDGKQIWTGRPFGNLDMRPREALANWLLCAVLAKDRGYEFVFAADPNGGDGLICDPTTGDGWPTEHVMVARLREGETGDAQTLILKAIEQKQRKGSAYAAGKTLVVLLEAGLAAGAWYPNKIAKTIPHPMLFESVWVVALAEVVDGSYRYNVTPLHVSEGDAPVFRVHIAPDFASWTVNRTQ